VGTVVEPYAILDVIAAGGMGVVFKARHTLTDRIVAMKLLPSELARDESNVQRVKLEAKALAQLKHPNIVTTYDFGFTPMQEPFIVMEYVAGESLKEVLDREVLLPVDRALRVFLQVVDGMRYAHAAKILHRDLKPHNIMVSEEPEPDHVKILDFGVAKLAEYTQKITRTGEVVGSPLYMSPEQCTGKPTDHRCDIYSIGVMMFETLTGNPPFRGENYISTVHLKCTKLAPNFKDVVPGRVFPERLEMIVLKCLEIDPDKRYPTMAELKADLELVAGVVPKVERPKTSQNLSMAPGSSSQRSDSAPVKADEIGWQPAWAGGPGGGSAPNTAPRGSKDQWSDSIVTSVESGEDPSWRSPSSPNLSDDNWGNTDFSKDKANQLRSRASAPGDALDDSEWVPSTPPSATPQTKPLTMTQDLASLSAALEASSVGPSTEALQIKPGGFKSPESNDEITGDKPIVDLENTKGPAPIPLKKDESGDSHFVLTWDQKTGPAWSATTATPQKPRGPTQGMSGTRNRIPGIEGTVAPGGAIDQSPQNGPGQASTQQNTQQHSVPQNGQQQQPQQTPQNGRQPEQHQQPPHQQPPHQQPPQEQPPHRAPAPNPWGGDDEAEPTGSSNNAPTFDPAAHGWVPATTGSHAVIQQQQAMQQGMTGTQLQQQGMTGTQQQAMQQGMTGTQLQQQGMTGTQQQAMQQGMTGTQQQQQGMTGTQQQAMAGVQPQTMTGSQPAQQSLPQRAPHPGFPQPAQTPHPGFPQAAQQQHQPDFSTNAHPGFPQPATQGQPQQPGFPPQQNPDNQGFSLPPQHQQAQQGFSAPSVAGVSPGPGVSGSPQGLQHGQPGYAQAPAVQPASAAQSAALQGHPLAGQQQNGMQPDAPGVVSQQNPAVSIPTAPQAGVPTPDPWDESIPPLNSSPSGPSTVPMTESETGVKHMTPWGDKTPPVGPTVGQVNQPLFPPSPVAQLAASLMDDQSTKLTTRSEDQTVRSPFPPRPESNSPWGESKPEPMPGSWGEPEPEAASPPGSWTEPQPLGSNEPFRGHGTRVENTNGAAYDKTAPSPAPRPGWRSEGPPQEAVPAPDSPIKQFAERMKGNLPDQGGAVHEPPTHDDTGKDFKSYEPVSLAELNAIKTPPVSKPAKPTSEGLSNILPAVTTTTGSVPTYSKAKARFQESDDESPDSGSTGGSGIIASGGHRGSSSAMRFNTSRGGTDGKKMVLMSLVGVAILAIIAIAGFIVYQHNAQSAGESNTAPSTRESAGNNGPTLESASTDQPNASESPSKSSSSSSATTATSSPSTTSSTATKPSSKPQKHAAAPAPRKEQRKPVVAKVKKPKKPKAVAKAPAADSGAPVVPRRRRAYSTYDSYYSSDGN
jgi:serine/threonine protein kinase